MTGKSFENSGARRHGLPGYFDLQARIGHTKHVGGWESTKEICEMLALDPGMELLYVGSGSGLAAIRISEEFGCRVVGVDLLEAMVETSREWAERKGAQERVEFRVADARQLPFDDDRFDALLCESVNTFVPDLQQAAGEYVRVVKPGGRVGLNEAVWYETPPEQGVRLMRELTGQELRRPHEWVEMLELAGLQDIQDRTYPVSMKAEVCSQVRFLKFGEYLRILWRAIRSLFTDPETRHLLSLATREPSSTYEYMGYGLYVGRVPEGG